MSHPNLHTAPALPARLLPVTIASSFYVGIAILLFFALSAVTFFVFIPKVVADELTPATLGSIAGVVKSANGTPQAHMQVSLFGANPNYAGYWSILRSVTTQADGQYRFTLLPPGIYRIGVSDTQRNFGSLYYPTAPTVQSAADITVAGNQLSGIDLVLQPGGQIVGTVTATGNFTLAGGSVELRQAVEQHGVLYWETVNPAVSLPAAGGVYSFTGLSPNTYRVCTYGYSITASTYECYDNVYAIDQATSLTLMVGATISNVNIVLGDGANFSEISGQVTTLKREPIAGIQVSASLVPQQGAPIGHTKSTLTLPILTPTVLSLATPRSYDDYGEWWTRTDNQGNYRLTTLPAGRYYLYFSDSTRNYTAEYYDNVLFTDSASVIEIAPKQIISNVNVQLGPGNHINGIVTLFDQAAAGGSVTAELKTPTGWRHAMTSYVNPITGHYDLDGLPDGSYRLSAYVFITIGQVSYFYQGYFGGNTPEAATEIALAAGESKLANLVLTGQAQFSGSVTGRVTAGGTALAGAKVSLYPRDFACCVSVTSLPSFQPIIYVFTDSAGRYAINGLTTGNVYLGVTDPSGIYATTYYTAHAVPATSNELAIEDTKALTGIDVNLPMASAISGRVTRRNGEPVAGLMVSTYLPLPLVFSQYQLVSVDTHTDGDGRYTVKGLHAGDYYICFTAGDYTECYGAPDRSYPGYFNSSHLLIPVVAGMTHSNIDLLWGPDLTSYLPLIAR